MTRKFYIQTYCHNKWQYVGNTCITLGYETKELAEQANNNFFKNHITIKPEMNRIVYIDFFEEAAE